MIKIAETDRYSIAVDKPKNRIYITHRGYWQNRDAVPGYIEDLKTAVNHLSEGFSGLTDMSSMESPNQEAWAVMSEGAELLVKSGMEKSAGIFGADAVVEMGAMRRASTTNMKGQAFNNRREALKWLDE